MRKILFSFLILLGLKTYAHPVAFQGATGVMTWNQSFMSDNWITYSYQANAAVAARMMRFDAPEGRSSFYAPQFDYLVKRWNRPDYQGNIYVFGAYGALTFQGQAHGAGLGGIETDIESRKYFASAKYEKMWGDLGPDFYHAEFRLGIAPYEAEFNEIASWFMIQYQYHPYLEKKNVITPLARIFYKNFLVEMGSSFDGDWMTNFMFHF